MSYYIEWLNAKTRQICKFDPNDTHFLLMSSEFWLNMHLRQDGKYEHHIIDTARSHISKNMNIIDIGANMGTHTVEFAKLTNGKVFSFEPQRIIFQQLNANVFVNRLFNVHTFNYALGSIEQDVSMKVNGQKEVDYTKFQTFGCAEIDEHSKQSETVKVKILDSFAIENVCLIKIDVEGYELNVLKGSINTIIKNNYPVIIYENHEKPEVHEFLKNLGYEITKIANTADYIAIHKITT